MIDSAIAITAVHIGDRRKHFQSLDLDSTLAINATEFALVCWRFDVDKITQPAIGIHPPWDTLIEPVNALRFVYPTAVGVLCGNDVCGSPAMPQEA